VRCASHSAVAKQLTVYVIIIVVIIIIIPRVRDVTMRTCSDVVNVCGLVTFALLIALGSARRGNHSAVCHFVIMPALETLPAPL